MRKFSNSDDVYDEFRRRLENDELLSLLCFAEFEKKRMSWIKHEVENSGNPPTPGVIKSWYESQPEDVLTDIISKSEDKLTSHIGDNIQLELIKKEKDIDKVLNEIRRSKKVFYQFTSGVFSSMLGSVLFSATLLIFGVLLTQESTLLELLESLVNVIRNAKSGAEQ